MVMWELKASAMALSLVGVLSLQVSDVTVACLCICLSSSNKLANLLRLTPVCQPLFPLSFKTFKGNIPY